MENGADKQELPVPGYTVRDFGPKVNPYVPVTQVDGKRRVAEKRLIRLTRIIQAGVEKK